MALSLDLAGLWPALSYWGYVVILVVVFLECFPIVGTIIPGGFMVVAAGFASSQGVMDPWGVALAAVAGAILGDTAAYEVGNKYGRGFIARHRGRSFLPEGMLRHTETAVKRHTWAAVLVGRFNQFTRALAPILSGALHVPRTRFLLWNVLGGVLWGLAHAFGGYFFGNAFLEVYERVGRDAIVGLVVLLAIAWAINKWRAVRLEEEYEGDARERVGVTGGEPPLG